MKTLFFGDVCPTMVTGPLFRQKRREELFADVPSVIEGHDFVFANLECALTEHDGAIKKFGPALKAPSETAEVLKNLGVNCCGLSNNHVFDYGVQGMEDTLKALGNAGLSYTGFGKDYEDSRRNHIVSDGEERVCVIAVCEHEYSYALEDRMGSRPYDEYDTMEDIREAKKKYDRVVVIYHGGKEYCQYPSPRLYRLCHAMARNGADAVLCQHSHCIGTYEYYHDCHILYGQGNFHFVKPNDSLIWHTGLIVTYDTKAHAMDFVPIRAGEKGISLAVGEDRENILEAFANRNEKMLNGEWKQGWHEFCQSVKDKYMECIAGAGREDSSEYDNHFFAHFLDCEAHTDVWRELFPSFNLTNERGRDSIDV